MVFVIIGLSFICLVAFFVFMIFLPEWVGISGKNSEKTRSEHQAEHQGPCETKQEEIK
jgi:hypothetical protein